MHVCVVLLAAVDYCLLSPDPKEDVYQALCPNAHHRWDKQGHPLYIERTGIIRMPDLLAHLEENDLVVRHVRHLEYVMRRMHNTSVRFGRNIEKHIIVFDLSGFQIKPDFSGNRVFTATMNIDQNYYPERLYKFFMINAPWYFRATWKLVKNFIDPLTRQKIEIMGTDYKEKLLEFIDAENLPVMYGGTCNCPGGCVTTQLQYPVKNEKDRAGLRKGYDEIPILTTVTPPKTDRDYYKQPVRRTSVLESATNGTLPPSAEASP